MGYHQIYYCIDEFSGKLIIVFEIKINFLLRWSRILKLWMTIWNKIMLMDWNMSFKEWAYWWWSFSTMIFLHMCSANLLFSAAITLRVRQSLLHYQTPPRSTWPSWQMKISSLYQSIFIYRYLCLAFHPVFRWTGEILAEWWTEIHWLCCWS